MKKAIEHASVGLARTHPFVNLELTVTVIPYIAKFTAQSTYTYLALVSVTAA